MMDDVHTERAAEYAMNKFHGLGVAVSIEGIKTVLDFVEEYFTEVYDPDEVEVVMFTHDDIIDYITGTRPDIPLSAVTTILDARQEFIESLYVCEEDEDDDRAPEGP